MEKKTKMLKNMALRSQKEHLLQYERGNKTAVLIYELSWECTWWAIQTFYGPSRVWKWSPKPTGIILGLQINSNK